MRTESPMHLVISRRTALLAVAAGVFGAASIFKASAAEAGGLATTEPDEATAKSAVDSYLFEAGKRGVVIDVQSLQASISSYRDLAQVLEHWGIVDGSRVISSEQPTPLFAALADRFSANHPPIELINYGASSQPLPEFYYGNKKWWYEPQEITEEVQRYVLKNEAGENYAEYFDSETLSQAASQVDIDSLEFSRQTKELFEFVEKNALFNSENVTFLFPDGSHPSDLITDTHSRFGTPPGGFEEVHFPIIPGHPTQTSSAAEMLLSSNSLKRTTTEKAELSIYFQDRLQRVQSSSAQNKTVPVEVVNFPFSDATKQLRSRLEKAGEGVTLDQLQMLAVCSLPNENVVHSIGKPLEKFHYAITSSAGERGILLPDEANGRLFEWSEDMYGLLALPSITSQDGLAELHWKFTLEYLGGNSFSCLALSLLIGVITSIHTARSGGTSLEEIEKTLFEVCPLTEKTRGTTIYQVRRFSMSEFKKFAEGYTQDVLLPWITKE